MTTRLFPLMLRRETFTSTPARLTIAAFAATSALFIAVASGTWTFLGWETADYAEGMAGFYKILAVTASILLLVPAASLGMASAKLSARRQDERLSTLSLLGAPRRTIVALAIAEPLTLAAIGTLVGVAASFLLVWPLSLLPFQGASLGFANMLLPWWLLVAIAVILLAVCLASAASGLRRIVISPLGVRTRRDAPKFPWIRVAIGGVLLLALGVAATLTNVLPMGASVVLLIFLGVVAGGLVVVNIVGVLFVKGAAHLALGRARTPERIIGARLVIDSPKQFWRRVQGLAMTAFTATFAGSAVAMLSGGAADSSVEDGTAYLAGDVVTGMYLTLGISFVLITVSAVLNQAADIYDRRDTYADLYAVGMEPGTAHRATVKAVMMPVVWVSALAGGLGLLLGLPFAGIALMFDPLTLAIMLASVVIGALIVRGGLQVTRPLVRTVAIAPR